MEVTTVIPQLYPHYLLFYDHQRFTSAPVLYKFLSTNSTALAEDLTKLKINEKHTDEKRDKETNRNDRSCRALPPPPQVGYISVV
jgi:hypothetical protein